MGRKRKRVAGKSADRETHAAEMPGQSYRHSLLYGLIACGLLSVAYLTTLSPGLSTGDSGELITAAATLGIPHPPGYPLWCLVMHFFTLIPAPNVAMMTNLATALFSVLSAFILYRIIVTFATLSPLLSAILVLVHGFNAILWGQSVITEVYTFNLFILLLFCYVFLLVCDSQRKKGVVSPITEWILLPLLCGVALISHGGNIVLLVPCMAWWFFTTVRKKPTLRHWGLWLLFFLAGLSVLLYLPIRARMNVVLDWGHPATWKGFVAHITRLQYGGFIWEGWGPFFSLLQQWLKDVSHTFTPLVWLLLGWSLFAWRRHKRVRWPLIWLLMAGPVSIFLLSGLLRKVQIVEAEVFFIPSFAFIALVVSFVLARLPKRWMMISGMVIALWAGYLFVLVKPMVDKSRNWIAFDYGLALLDSLPPNAVLFASEDYEVFPIIYLQTVQSRRPDVSLRVFGQDVDHDAYGHPVERTADLRAEQSRPICVTKPKPPFQNDPLTPLGLVFRVGVYHPEWKPIRIRYDHAATLTHAERMLLSSVAYHRLAYALSIRRLGDVESILNEIKTISGDDPAFLNNAAALLANYGEIKLAIDLWQDALDRDQSYLGVWVNLIRAHRIMGHRREALELLENARVKFPNALVLRQMENRLSGH